MACLKERKRELKENAKTICITLRVNHEDYKIAKQKAALYAGQNVSLWIRSAMRSYVPRKSDLDFEK